MANISPLITIGMALLLGLGCRTDDKPQKTRYDEIDGGYVMREECNLPAIDCHKDCIKRDASITCTGCCRDQRFLCDTRQPHSFESCRSTR